MAANQRDVRKFYAMIKDNCYPKNGSWKDAKILKNYVWLVGELIALGALYDYWH